jgi:hypothetical protein
MVAGCVGFARKRVNWLTQLSEFVGGLFAHWVGLLTGGVGVLLLGLWERKRRPITSPAYFALAIAAVLPAAYLSWLDEHQLRLNAEARIAGMANAATEKPRFVFKLNNTQAFIHRAEDGNLFLKVLLRYEGSGSAVCGLLLDTLRKYNRSIAGAEAYALGAEDREEPGFPDTFHFSDGVEHYFNIAWIPKQGTAL